MRDVSAAVWLTLSAWPSVLCAQDRWQTDQRVDPITDEREIVAWVQGWGEDRREDELLGRPQASARCSSEVRRNRAIWFDTIHRFLDSGNVVLTTIRVDQNPVMRFRLNINTKGTAVRIDPEDLGVLAKLVEQMRQGLVLRVRVQDWRGTEHDLRFSLSGFSRAIERLPCLTADSLAMPDVANEESGGPSP